MALYKEYEKLPLREGHLVLARKPLNPLTMDQNMAIEVVEGESLAEPSKIKFVQGSLHEPVPIKGEELKKLIDSYVKEAMKRELKQLCSRFSAVVDASL
jgi:hypothetical protein